MPSLQHKSKPSREDHWSKLPREELLGLRICDLGVTLDDSPLAARVEDLDSELERRGLRFRPHTWLSTEWFSPDDTCGFAIPFYLAHPKLIRLERSQMLEVEGGSQDECMKLMRHEAAHALDNAYGLRRRRSWREVFGRAGTPYRNTYAPDPTSREFVEHLGHWYSQSHPLEDFAETFAVWLKPGSRWKSRYRGWPALAKLEYVDRLMEEIKDLPPRTKSRRTEEPVSRVRITLRTYYDRKKQVYADEGTPAFDGQLIRAFPSAKDSPAKAPRLASFLRRNRESLVKRVSDATGQHRYLLDHVVREMVERAMTHDLRLPNGEDSARIDVAILLTALSSQFLYGAHPRFQR